jgi:hypothetical protein
MCSDAPKIVGHFRKLWTTASAGGAAALQEGGSWPFSFLTIGPRSEWHQAVAIIGHEQHPFSVRSPLILDNKSCKSRSTVQIRPYFEGSSSAAFDKQPRGDGAALGRSQIVDGAPPAAYLDVIGYAGVPSIWPFARPDMEYNINTWTAGSTEALAFSCPVMGRRRFSCYFQNRTETSTLQARFTGVQMIDDSMHESTLLNATGIAQGKETSYHLDIDVDAFQWIRFYSLVEGGGSDSIGNGEVSFVVRD